MIHIGGRNRKGTLQTCHLTSGQHRQAKNRRPSKSPNNPRSQARGANLLAELFERILLPRPNDHAWDLYNVWKDLAKIDCGAGGRIWSLIEDFEDAN